MLSSLCLGYFLGVQCLPLPFSLCCETLLKPFEAQLKCGFLHEAFPDSSHCAPQHSVASVLVTWSASSHAWLYTGPPVSRACSLRGRPCRIPLSVRLNQGALPCNEIRSTLEKLAAPETGAYSLWTKPRPGFGTSQWGRQQGMLGKMWALE